MNAGNICAAKVDRRQKRF